MLSLPRIRWMRAYLPLCFFLLLAFGPGAGPAFPRAQPQVDLSEKNVLVLHSYEANVPFFLQVDKGLSTVLKSGGIPSLNQFFESLDLRRTPGPGHRKLLVEQMRARYGHRKPDIIITMFPEALEFVLKDCRQILDDIIRDDRRADEVVQKVRALVRKETPRREFQDLNKAIQAFIALIRGESLLQGLSITMELSPNLKMILGDRIQLQQVILNLILNRAAAMKNCPLAQRNIILRTAMQDSGTIKASVTDFGTGIDENNIERLFEPFYTTKPEGLGIGLSISRGIIKAHGGTIEASNNPEGGATFALTLPEHQGDAS